MSKQNNKVKIHTTGKLKEHWIKQLNKDVGLNEEAREKMGKNNKCYLVVSGDRYLDKVYRDKRARGYVQRKQGESYYSEISMSMVSYGAGLEVVEIKADEILELDDPKLFYNFLYKEYRNIGTGFLNETRIKHYVQKYEMHKKDEDIKYLASDKHLLQMKKGQFEIVERLAN